MYVQTHIFIISKYEVKDAQVLYYITESISVRLGKWRRPIFCNKYKTFSVFCSYFIKPGFFFEIFNLNDRV